MNRKGGFAVRTFAKLVGTTLVTLLLSSPALTATPPAEAGDPLQDVLDAARIRVEELVARRDALPDGEARTALDAEIVRAKREGEIELLRRRLELQPDDALAAAALARLLDPAPAPPPAGVVEEKAAPRSAR
jgi:hypothetical protein